MNTLAERFMELFAAHDIQLNQIPRLIPLLKYQDLDSPKELLAAITPEVIDSTAQLFGIRSEWLEGLDDTIYQPVWARGKPQVALARLAAAIAARGQDYSHMPLRVLATSKNLDRRGQHQQWLLPVIVETVDYVGDTPVHRCHPFGYPYYWTDETSRLELKAIARLVWDQLKTTVPLYQVTPKEIDRTLIGQSVPSVLWRKGLISELSLEDFVLSEKESRQAKETDELVKLFAYLEASGLKEWSPDASIPLSKTAEPEADALQEPKDLTSAEPAKPDVAVPTKPGKRQAQQASWSAILTAAQTTWARPPYLSYADMIQRLKSIPHLKASALSDSAIHKRLRPIAPPEVRDKPGRKPNQSA